MTDCHIHAVGLAHNATGLEANSHPHGNIFTGCSKTVRVQNGEHIDTHRQSGFRGHSQSALISDEQLSVEQADKV